MVFGDKVREWKLQKIRKGWHDHFAWFPQRLEGEGIAWLETIERKYYAQIGNTVVKKGLNEGKLRSYFPLKKMYRKKGSNAERTVYYKRNGTAFADPNETWNRISDKEKNRISKSLDSLEK